jgi:hypothetical protein
MHGLYGLPVNGLFSIPLQVFLTMVPPPDPMRLSRLERGLDEIARDHDLSDRDARTLKDSLVEPFRQEGMPIGPDTVQWLQLLNRRLLALPPGVVSAGAELQWTTLGLSRYATGLTFQQYLGQLVGSRSAAASAEEAVAPSAEEPGSAPEAEKPVGKRAARSVRKSAAGKAKSARKPIRD